MREKKSEPQPDRAPTEDQLTALNYRVNTAKRTPYVDLSIRRPYGRKTYKRNKSRNWILFGDGEWISQEILGPENYSVWLIGWRVFATACVMLGIVAPAVLEAYEARIEKIVRLWSDAWHLIYTADDLMRAEQIERIRRQLSTAAKAGHPVPLTWNIATPWSA